MATVIYPSGKLSVDDPNRKYWRAVVLENVLFFKDYDDKDASGGPTYLLTFDFLGDHTISWRFATAEARDDEFNRLVMHNENPLSKC